MTSFVDFPFRWSDSCVTGAPKVIELQSLRVRYSVPFTVWLFLFLCLRTVVGKSLKLMNIGNLRKPIFRNCKENSENLPKVGKREKTFFKKQLPARFRVFQPILGRICHNQRSLPFQGGACGDRPGSLHTVQRVIGGAKDLGTSLEASHTPSSDR